ncbi:MAG: hypothetical protein GQE15_23020 [Archangiaceae bacterium]|nr:hypothetical protein [Archangiaceae bacterium]
MPNTSLNRRTVMSGLALFAASSCGYVLYPGRRGRTGGRIDIPVLIIDLLWFIPGVLPGVICLIVDFTSGCIYGGGGRASTSSSPSPLDSRVTTVEIELDGKVVATGEVAADRKANLTWSQQVDDATLRARGKVRVISSDGASAAGEVSALV